MCKKILKFDCSVIDKNVNCFTKLPLYYKILIKIAFCNNVWKEINQPFLLYIDFVSRTGRKEGFLTYLTCFVRYLKITNTFFERLCKHL